MEDLKKLINKGLLRYDIALFLRAVVLCFIVGFVASVADDGLKITVEIGGGVSNAR